MNNAIYSKNNSSHHLANIYFHMIFMLITCITSCSFPSHLTSTLTLPCYSVTSVWDSTVAATVFLTVVTIATTGTRYKYFHKGKNCRYIMILKKLITFSLQLSFRRLHKTYPWFNTLETYYLISS